MFLHKFTQLIGIGILFSGLAIIPVLLNSCTASKAAPIVNAIEQQEIILHAAITIGVGKLVIDKPQYAQPLHDAAKATRALVTATQEVDTAQVVKFLNEQLKLAPLTPQDQLLLQSAVDALVEEVRLIIRKMQPENVRVLADKVLSWVQVATMANTSVMK